MMFRRAVARGFTLIEMAIVMVVIGLILAGGIGAFGPVLENSKRAETKSTLFKIEQALIVYAVQFSCLPCPAADDSATGLSQTVGAAAGCGTSCTADFGAVPWQTLGLSRAQISDAYNNRIRYGVTPTLVVANSMARVGSNYAPLGGITVNTRNNAGAIAVVTAEAAFVLVSHGQNGGYGFNAESGVQRPGDATHVDETENNDADTTYVQGQMIDIEGATYFDDVVEFRTKPLLVQLCGSGACGNPA